MFVYRWTHSFSIPPLEAVIDAVEAFCTTLSPVRYEPVKRERFCIEFRRGAWRSKWLDPAVQVPKFTGINRLDVNTWPTLLRVTTLPSPDAFQITLLRKIQMPNGLSLQQPHYELGETAFNRETESLVMYLVSFLKLAERPDVTRDKRSEE